MYDVLYIGGGLNYAGAIVAAKNGLKVALVEKEMDLLGGTCLHKGCIPSKMFLHYANTLRQSRSTFFEGTLTLEMKTLVEKKNRLRQNANKAVRTQCREIDLIEGEGKLTAPHTVEVRGKTYEAKTIVIGTGSSAFIPEGIAYDRKNIITSDEVLEMKQLPKTIAIYGDGAIGREMASFFVSSGVKVTLISRHEGLLKGAHTLIANSMQKQMDTLGIEHLGNHPVTKARMTQRGVHVGFEDGSSRYFETLLVATGRRPNTDVIGTDTVKVEKGIVTDDDFETTLSGHYAIGDCNGKLQLAHAARAEALYVTQKILGRTPHKLNLSHVVKFMHTLPMSYAWVGETRHTLEKRNADFKESVMPLNRFTASVFHDAVHGMMITYADGEGFILGAEILAPDAEELIAPVAMALAGEMDAPLAQRTIMAHPTFSEALERSWFKL
ncbi:Dihydrolipoamide dehydrogenase of branched-chain alpha-keto acid dehydrogenase [hydrothermal vent metagenome]|uniref:Dihydrolipoamide dehydrogenase of branched-chain alpha-keto acid dehydrogenase n=1 Tax=hydrothermal vent metagenome TaxID=652676 RepID=A0A1W1CQN2_9ZZZZ